MIESIQCYPRLVQGTKQINAVDLEALSQVSSSDISTAIESFKLQVNNRKEQRLAANEPAAIEAAPEIKPMIEKNTSPEKEDKVPKTLSEKIQQQPPQLIACIINQVDDAQKKTILGQLSKEKKQLVESIEVENTPISDEVIKVILNELELTALTPQFGELRGLSINEW